MQKTEIQGIVKESEGVLLNVDNSALASYRKKKLREENINKLEAEICDIKSMLHEVMTLLKGAKNE
jgi:hypothetical protein